MRTQQKILRSPDVLLLRISRVRRVPIEASTIPSATFAIRYSSELAVGIKNKELAGRLPERAESTYEASHIITDPSRRRRVVRRPSPFDTKSGAV